MNTEKINNNIQTKNTQVGYTINFGIKDKDLWSWVSSIPSGRFSFIIKDMIRAYYSKDKYYRLPKYEVNKKPLKPSRKSFAFGQNDDDIYEFISSFDNSTVSHTIKEIIRYFVNNQTGHAPLAPKITPEFKLLTNPIVQNQDTKKPKVSKEEQTELYSILMKMNN